MPNFKRLLLASLFAPLTIPVLFCLVWPLLVNAGGVDRGIFVAFIIAMIFSYSFTFIFIVPSVFLLRKLDRLSLLNLFLIICTLSAAMSIAFFGRNSNIEIITIGAILFSLFGFFFTLVFGLISGVRWSST